MDEVARTRSEINIQTAPSINSNVADRLPADCPVEILEDLNRWLQVKPARMLHGITGYLPQVALTYPQLDSQPVFPNLPAGGESKPFPSVPSFLPVKDFTNWLDIGSKPTWIPDKKWKEQDELQQAAVIRQMRVATVEVQSRWSSWLATLTNYSRMTEATMNEWIVIMQGGSDEFALRDHYIYADPLKGNGVVGSVVKGQIMRWNGEIISGMDEFGKLRSYHEVDFYRLNRYLHGWFRADVTAEYVFPTNANDPDLESNAQTVFNLSTEIMRRPADPEIDEARKKGYYGAQYIDVFGATKSHLVHYSLCGEFCVAAVCGKDVIPVLKTWFDSKEGRVNSILHNPHEGTSVGDLKALLTLLGIKSDVYSPIPTSPQIIKARLDAGQYAIVGCGINGVGKLKANGKIRHWVVLEDIIPSGSSGWVRVYNPFQNQDEVYEYDLFIASSGTGAGLWITPAA